MRLHAPPPAEGWLAVAAAGHRYPLQDARGLDPPRSRRLALAQRPAKPFPWPPGSDTILIACSPAVQFNLFCPAGLALSSVLSPACGPPDKPLFVGQ